MLLRRCCPKLSVLYKAFFQFRYMKYCSGLIKKMKHLQNTVSKSRDLLKSRITPEHLALLKEKIEREFENFRRYCQTVKNKKFLNLLVNSNGGLRTCLLKDPSPIEFSDPELHGFLSKYSKRINESLREKKIDFLNRLAYEDLDFTKSNFYVADFDVDHDNNIKTIINVNICPCDEKRIVTSLELSRITPDKHIWDSGGNCTECDGHGCFYCAFTGSKEKFK